MSFLCNGTVFMAQVCPGRNQARTRSRKNQCHVPHDSAILHIVMLHSFCARSIGDAQYAFWRITSVVNSS